MTTRSSRWDRRADLAGSERDDGREVVEVEPDGYDAFCAWKGVGAQRRHLLVRTDRAVQP